MKAENITTKCLDNPPAVIKFQKRSSDLEGHIDNPMPKKTVAIIALGPLNEENGVCGTWPAQYPDLQSAQAAIISGNATQYYSRRSVGGGLAVTVRLKYEYQDPEGHIKR